MPKDYSLNATLPNNAQRRPEHMRDDDWARDFLRRAHVGHVATRWGGQPFINPTLFWYDPERREIYFHSNAVGRMRANAGQSERVCFEASEFGKLLPANVALEFSIQYQSLIAYGRIRVLEDFEEKRRAAVWPYRQILPDDDGGERISPDHRGRIKTHQRLCDCD